MVHRLAVLASAASILLLSGAATAEERLADRPLRGVYLSTGAGIGTSYGLIGTSTAVDARSKYIGASAHLGVGALTGFGFRVWSPGNRVRVGVGLDMGLSWSLVVPHKASGGECGGGGGPSGVGYSSLNADVDHDIARFGGLGLRYGLGLGAIASGCAAAPMPSPTLAARYAF